MFIKREKFENLRQRMTNAEAAKAVLERQQEERDAECRSLQLRVWKLENELSSEKQKSTFMEYKVKDRLWKKIHEILVERNMHCKKRKEGAELCVEKETDGCGFFLQSI